MGLEIVRIAGIALLGYAMASADAVAQDASLADIVANCRIKTNAADLRGSLNFTIRKDSGEVLKERQAVYFWRDYAGSDDLWSKTILFMLGPPDVKDFAYLRYEYSIGSAREPDQWLYTPKQQRVRRMAKRDASDKTWGIVGDDLQVLNWGAGEQKFLRTEQEMRGTIYWVEITPALPRFPFTKVHAAYLRKGDRWEDCSRWRSEFFDKDNNKIKTVTEEWSQSEHVWYRNRVTVDDKELRTVTEYAFSDIKIDNSFTDDDFATRQLPHASRFIRGKQ